VTVVAAGRSGENAAHALADLRVLGFAEPNLHRGHFVMNGGGDAGTGRAPKAAQAQPAPLTI